MDDTRCFSRVTRVITSPTSSSSDRFITPPPRSVVVLPPCTPPDGSSAYSGSSASNQHSTPSASSLATPLTTPSPSSHVSLLSPISPTSPHSDSHDTAVLTSDEEPQRNSSSGSVQPSCMNSKYCPPALRSSQRFVWPADDQSSDDASTSAALSGQHF